MTHELANLQLAVAKLHALLEDHEDIDAPQLERPVVRDAVHEVNAAYLDWAFTIDNATLTVVS
jgi:hypothetical protein